MAMKYNNPAGGNNSSVGKQFNEPAVHKKSFIEAAYVRMFSPLAESVSMPLHMGKKFVARRYIPILDNRNMSAEGIDANGQIKTGARAGALFGGNRDINSVTSGMPKLGEEGGRVNYVEMVRTEMEGEIKQVGFFTEYTRESFMFDDDKDLFTHLSREMMRAAQEIYELSLQKDLISAADVRMYPGVATQLSEISGNDNEVTLLSSKDLKRLDQTLTENRAERNIKMITGSGKIDTKVIPKGRALFVSHDMGTVLQEMDDFIPVEHYGGTTKPYHEEELGSLKSSGFRVIPVRDMLYHAGKGKSVTDNAGYKSTNGKYDVGIGLVVGNDAFATIGLQGQSGGKEGKYNVLHRSPGIETMERSDPYGLTGRMSISFYYGFIKLRGERIAVAYSVIPE